MKTLAIGGTGVVGHELVPLVASNVVTVTSREKFNLQQESHDKVNSFMQFALQALT